MLRKITTALALVALVALTVAAAPTYEGIHRTYVGKHRAFVTFGPAGSLA